MTRSSNRTAGVISRVQSIELQSFRGFKGQHKIDTDADIVLLTGPNGCGKTSLLEALLLVLTGHHYHQNSDALVSLESNQQAVACNSPDSANGCVPSVPCRIVAEVSTVDREVRTLSWHPGLSSPAPKPESRLNSPELESRLTAFFQDRFEDLFDETTTGRTLRDVFEPPPEPWPSIKNILEKAEARLTHELEQYTDVRAEKRTARYIDDLNEILARLRAPYQVLLNASTGLPALPESIMTEEDLIDVAEAVLKHTQSPPVLRGAAELPKRFVQALLRELKQKISELKEVAENSTSHGRVLRARRTKLADDRKAIEREFPHLEERFNQMSSVEPGEPNLQQVFQALARNAERWSKGNWLSQEERRNQRFARALRELSAVAPDQANQCSVMLKEPLRILKQAHQRWQEISDEMEEVEARLQRLYVTGRLAELQSSSRLLAIELNELEKSWQGLQQASTLLRKAAERKAARDYLINAKEACEKAIRSIESSLTISSSLGPPLNRLVNVVLGRFSLVDGIWPTRLVEQKIEVEVTGEQRRRFRIETADGRGLRHLSTGQRAQMAIALMAAQNVGVTSMLGHRILLLDDMTTAYDLSNLTREAILWRQLAFGPTEGDAHRRQIFISSHHEDLTNHLLDLLVPPHGRSVRLLRFHGWDTQTGPKIESRDIIPSGASRASGVAGNGGTQSSLGWSAEAEALRDAMEVEAWRS